MVATSGQQRMTRRPCCPSAVLMMILHCFTSRGDPTATTILPHVISALSRDGRGHDAVQVWEVRVTKDLCLYPPALRRLLSTLG
jgi:hypothetical protein